MSAGTSPEKQPCICRGCGTPIECCEFCERTDCPAAVCYRCLNVDLRQTLAHPHLHGG
jgi:hypothetical protein